LAAVYASDSQSLVQAAWSPGSPSQHGEPRMKVAAARVLLKATELHPQALANMAQALAKVVHAETPSSDALCAAVLV